MSSTGASAFGRLFDETMSRIKVPFGDEILSEEDFKQTLQRKQKGQKSRRKGV